MTGGSFPVASHVGEHTKYVGKSHIYGPSSLHLPILTIGLLGMQLFWSVEMSYGSPYLISLGLTKSSMAMVFLAGPLSGLFVQPLIGILADTSTSRWGRRRPYMIGASLIAVLAMLLLGWTKQVAAWFIDNPRRLTTWLAILAIYTIDFSVNAVMSVDRSLLVDMLPASKQAAANAWGARMIAIGSVVGFYAGNLDLPKIMPFLGATELSELSILVSFLLLGCHLATALFIKEKILLKDETVRRRTFSDEFKDMFSTIRMLPRTIRQICMIQFFSWIAWFPILFYTTLYIGDTYKRTVYASAAAVMGVGPSLSSLDLANATSTPTSSSSIDPELLDAEATRLGARALLYSSLVTLVANFLLPFFVAETSSHFPIDESEDYSAVGSARGLRDLPTRKYACHIPDFLHIHMASLWTLSQGVFVCCMFATLFTNTVGGATILITLTGFSWAVTMWAPMALLAEAILTSPTPATADDVGFIQLMDTRASIRRSGSLSIHRRSSSDPLAPNHDTTDPEPIVLETDSDSDTDSVVRERLAREQQKKRQLFANRRAGMSLSDVTETEYGDRNNEFPEAESAGLVVLPLDVEDGADVADTLGTPPGLSSKAGIIFGIQNVFVVIPQFIVTGIASLIFAIFDPAKDTSTDSATSVDIIEFEPSNSIVYVFRVGGVSAFVALVLCYRLSNELKRR